MSRRAAVCTALLCSVVAAGPVSGAAQAPAGAATLPAAAVAESLAVLRALSDSLAASPRDAALWHRRGMVAWTLAERAKAKPPIAGLDAPRLGETADTSLRQAAALAPRNARYRLLVGRFLLASGVAFTRQGAYAHFDAALAIARADTNTFMHAETAVEVGRIHWRRYDALANRRIEVTPGFAVRSLSSVLRPDLGALEALNAETNAAFFGATSDPISSNDAGATGSLSAVRDMLQQTTQPLPDGFSGERDYLLSEQLFKEAYAAEPTQARAFRSLAMALAERSRWTELSALARAQIGRAPWDPWAWLTLGLASHRRDDASAAAAFDSAMTYLSPADRTRFNDLSRVLREADAQRVARASPEQRAATERLYWLTADPLWAREGNEARIEFLARVAYAELRWTVDELGVRGVDSDRGDVYVRYGPPGEIAVIGPDAQSAEQMLATVWAYTSGLVFVFNGAPTYGTARIPREDMKLARGIVETQAVRWDNLTAIRVDSMPVQAARFRGGRDSVDLFIATLPPVGRIRDAAAVRGSVRADYWLLAGGTVPIRRDSLQLDTTSVRSWTARVAPGTYLYRLEASADASTIAARASAAIVAGDDAPTGFAMRGFGMSDVVMAAGLDVPAGARRWTDAALQPMTGGVRRGGRIALLWEIYDVAASENFARYNVAITIRRERSGGERIMANVLGPLASVAGVDRTNDRVVVRFDRDAPHAAIVVDHVDIGLGDTPRGRYIMTVEVTDRTTKRASARSMALTIF